MDILKIYNWKDFPENYTGIIEWNTGTMCYYLNEILHREDGPAVIWDDDTMFYYVNGKLHREDGPAFIYPDGRIFYYINDKNITEEVNIWIKDNKIPKDWNNSHKILFKLTFG